MASRFSLVRGLAVAGLFAFALSGCAGIAAHERTHGRGAAPTLCVLSTAAQAVDPWRRGCSEPASDALRARGLAVGVVGGEPAPLSMRPE